MLSQQSKKDIKRTLNFIYKSTKSKKELNVFADEIFQVINNYNKFGKKTKTLKISEKTSVLICYGDSLLNSSKKKTIKIFKKFYKKKLDQFFDVIHSWLVSFLIRVAFVLGWTVLIVQFINYFGLKSIPLLFITHALASLFGHLVFRKIISNNIYP